MEKKVDFWPDGYPFDGEGYQRFLDYAFATSDFFMLVFVAYQGHMTQQKKALREELRPYKVKRRTDPSWPGTLVTYSINTRYQVTFYRTDPQAKAIVKRIHSLYAWNRQFLPQDLAFFRGDQCWFASVAHEQMAFLLHATKEDITLMTEIGAIKPGDVEPMTDDDLTYYAQFDEKLVRPKNDR